MYNPKLRRFKIIREPDPTAIPCEAIVAEGVEFSNGRVAVMWEPRVKTLILFDSMHDMKSLMADSPTTHVEYIDEPTL